MISQKAKIQEAVSFIRKKTQSDYPVGIVLGTGLGALAKEIDVEFALDYADIPNFPISTVETHHGQVDFRKAGRKECCGHAGALSFL